MDKKLEKQAFEWAKKNRKKIVKKILSNFNNEKYKTKQIYFLAGSPGSGKTEFINSILDEGFSEYFLHIDLDELRKLIEGYTGNEADSFQKGAIKIMELLLDKAFSKGLNIILDGTFGSKSATEKNIERVLRKGYNIKIFYIKFDPILAWKFTLGRELEKKRKIPLFSFYNQYYNSFKNIKRILNKFNFIKLIVLEKHLTNSGLSSKIYIINTYQEFLKKEEKIKPKNNKIYLLFNLFLLKIKLGKK